MTDAATVVVMTRDRWPDLRASLPRHEVPVVVVDNGSQDGTPELVARHFPEVEVVRLRRNLGAVARNVGVQRASTPYVAFADDDSWWAPGALAAAVQELDAHPRCGVVVARVVVGPDESPDPVNAAMAAAPLGTEPDLPGPSVLGFLACSAVFRRDAFLGAGGFDDVVHFLGEEERLALDLATAGWGMAYVADVVVHHHPSVRRETDRRKVLASRNTILTAVMRRPWAVVARIVVGELRSGRTGRTGVLHALPRLPSALRRRKVVPAHVEAARRRLDAVT